MTDAAIKPKANTKKVPRKLSSKPQKNRAKKSTNSTKFASGGGYFSSRLTGSEVKILEGQIKRMNRDIKKQGGDFSANNSIVLRGVLHLLNDDSNEDIYNLLLEKIAELKGC